MAITRILWRRPALLALAGLVAWSGAGWAETWMLMGREGGCVSLADAAQRAPEFDGVAGPEDLVRALRAQGHDVTLNEIGTPEARVVSVEAPDAGIAAIFAPAHLCGN